MTLNARYMANQISESREEIISIIHRAIVEIMTLKEANLPLEIDKEANNPSDEYLNLVAKSSRFETINGDQTSLVLEPEGLREAVLEYIQPRGPIIDDSTAQEEDGSDTELWQEEPEGESLQTTDTGEGFQSATLPARLETTNPEQAGSSLEEEDHLQTTKDPSAHVPADDSWRQVSLADPDFKFAVLSDLFCIKNYFC